MILIVDDKAENILPLKKILQLNGFESDSASSGEMALLKILKNTYTLIILDVQMPGMDGFEVAETISTYSKAKDTPIIFLSAANKEKSFITKGYLAGAIDYIIKPVDPDILLLKVRTFVKLFEHQQALKVAQTELLKEIETRKAAEENMRMVLESLPQLAFTLGPAGDIEYVNKHWLEYSVDPKEFPTAHPNDLHVWDEWKKSFANGEKFFSEIRLLDPASDYFNYFLLKIIPVLQHNIITRWVGTFSNIQQQKLANDVLEKKVHLRTEELLTKNAELEIMNNELQQFTWVVSHDLKEPLRKIQTFNNLVKQKYLNGNAEATAYIDRSIHSASRLVLLISDLLDFTRLSATSPFMPTDLNEVLNNVLNEYEDAIIEKDALIIRGAMPVIDAAGNQLGLVFQNLLSNALKFSRQGVKQVIEISAEIVLEKKIDSLAQPGGKFCRIVFKDNGIGFNEEYLDKIFVIFQQLNTREEYAGTGIGLAITKKIVEKHNGIISATSHVNEGTSFIIILPIEQINPKNKTREITHEPILKL